MITILTSEKVAKYFDEELRKLRNQLQNDPLNKEIQGQITAYETALAWLYKQSYYNLRPTFMKEREKDKAMFVIKYTEGFVCPRCNWYWEKNWYRLINFRYCPHCGQRWRTW